MDPFPKEIPDGQGASWHRRPHLDGEGVAYQFGDSPTVGNATGRLTAAIPGDCRETALEWLAENGFRTRVLHEGPTAVVAIEHDDRLRPLKMLSDISSVPGLKETKPEILLPKSKKGS